MFRVKCLPNVFFYICLCLWGSVVLLNVSFSLVNVLLDVRVNNIVYVLEEFRIKLLCLVQLYMSCKYECTYYFAVYMLV